MRRAWLLVLVAVAGCAARTSAPPPPPPPPAAIPTSPPAAASEETCITRRERAQALDCSAAVPWTTRQDVERAIADADLELVSSPARVPSLTRRSLIGPRVPLPKQARAITIATSYVCHHPSDVEMSFALARLQVDVQRFAEAAVLFEKVVEGPTEDALPPEALMRWLEMTNLLGTELGRTSCFDAMMAIVPRERPRLCAFDIVKRNPDRASTCTMLGKINYDLDRMAAQLAAHHAEQRGAQSF